MRSLRGVVFSSIALVVACSPAAPPEVKTAVTPPPPKPAPPPEQTHARWLLGDSVGTPLAQLDLGDKGVLQVGRRGRRWRVARDGAIESSSFLLTTDLVDVRRAGEKFLLLGADGTVFLVDEPLGAAKVTRTSPSKNAMYAAGREALIGVEHDGTIHRSTDGGATWKKNNLAVPKGDKVVSVVANARGETLILAHPQRMFVSLDDAATFAPLPTPGIGATLVARDANGDLWLRSENQEKNAKLLASPTRLEIATTFEELAAPKKAASNKPKNEPRKQLVGGRLVTVTEDVDSTTKRKKIEVNVAPLAGSETPTYVLAASASPFTRVHLAGHENIVVAGLYDPETEPRGTKLFRTTDDGKNWEPLGVVEGTEDSGFRVLAAPGVVAIGRMCGTAPPCMPPRAKLGGKDWQPLGVAASARLGAMEYDSARDRLFVVTLEDAQPVLYAGKKGEPLKQLDAKLPKVTPRATTVDKDGTLRLVFDHPWRIEKIGADLTAKGASYLPFAPQGIDLVGDRGYAWSHEQAWETADGGEHWLPVPAGAAGHLACGMTGCLQSGAVRLGWDLPNPSATLLASTSTPATSKVEPAKAPPVSKTLEASCKTTGAWKTFAGSFGTGQAGGYDNNVQMLAMVTAGEYGEPRGVTVFRAGAAPKEHTLLGPGPKESESRSVRSWSTENAKGLVLARYSFSLTPPKDPDKRYNPVDVELGWYSTATGKAHKASLPQVKPFRVGRTGPSALTSIVDGGLLFLPNRGEAPLYFITDAGKVQAIPRPPSPDDFGFSEGVKIGNQLVLSQYRGEDTALTTSNDGGKTWTTTIWTLGESAKLTAFDGKPTLTLGASMWETSEVSGFLSFTTVTPDPPTAVRFATPITPIGDKTITACSKPGLPFTPAPSETVANEVHFTVTGDKAPIAATAVTGSMRGAADGSTCTEFLFTSAQPADDDVETFLYVAPSDPAHGWLLRRKTFDKFDARPIACTLP